MNILEVENLSYKYTDSSKHAIDSVSFNVKEKDYLAILGANGSGKSTLVRCIVGLLKPNTGTVLLKNLAALVFQFPADQIIGETIELDIAFGPENLGIDRKKMIPLVQDCMDEFNFTHLAETSTQKLTTGQKQGLALASTKALQPKILLLDEPTSMLSAQAREKLLIYLERFREKGGTVLHITHNLEEAERADRVIVLDDGILVFDGSPEELKKEKEKKLLAWKLLYKSHIRLHKDSMGFLTMITGESGSGKSLVLETLAGLRKMQDGSFFIPIEKTCALAVQEIETSLFAEFLVDDIAFGPKNAGLKGKNLVHRVQETMELVGLPFDVFSQRRTFSLSGGEKRKAGLAGILAMQTDIILLDEPSSALDIQSRGQFLALLKTLRSQGKIIVCTTNRKEELSIADVVIDLGNPEDLGIPGACNSIKEKIIQKAESEATQIAKKLGFQSLKNVQKKENLTKSYKKKQIKDKTYKEFLDKERELHTVERLRAGAQGSYTFLDTPIHRLSPLTKYLLVLSAILIAVFAQHWTVLLVALFLETIVMNLSKLPLKRFVRSLVFVLPWLVLFALIQLMLDPKNFLTPTIFLLRFIALFIPLSVFTFSTGPSEIMYGIQDLLNPLCIFRIPVRDISLIIGIVFRFMNLLYEEAARISLARIIRGASMYSGVSGRKKQGLFVKITSTTSLFVPLMIRTLTRADRLSQAITMRYYGKAKSSRYAQWNIDWSEHVLRIGILIITFGFLLYTYMEKR